MKKMIISMLKSYQRGLSPVLHDLGVRCKYHPTCSEYTIQAVEKYGVIRGLIKGFFRILRCNPFSKGGYDPLK